MRSARADVFLTAGFFGPALGFLGGRAGVLSAFLGAFRRVSAMTTLPRYVDMLARIFYYNYSCNKELQRVRDYKF